MEFRKIGFWDALRAGRPLARYEADLNGTPLYLTERQYRALAADSGNAAATIRQLNDAKTDAETAVAVYREEAEANMKRVSYLEAFQVEQFLEIDALNDRLSAKNREAAALRAERDQAQVMLSNARNGNGHFDFLRTSDPLVQRYAADFLKTCMPKPRKDKVKVFDREYHETPRQFDSILTHLKKIPYITEIHWHNALAKKNDVVGVKLEEETGRYWVDATYKCNNFNARMRLYTTARNEQEASFVGYCVGLALK